MAKVVLATMAATGDCYFFFAPGSDRGTTAFRSDMGTSSLAGPRPASSPRQAAESRQQARQGSLDH